MIKLKVPKFATEAEEAKWWDDHMDVVQANFLEGLENGTLKTGAMKRLTSEARQSKNIIIRMPLNDIERARLLAERKGIGYQTYIKILLHEALEKEESRLAG